MQQRNNAFFNLFENTFLVLKEEFGEDEALRLFRIIMENGLKTAYGNEFTKGKAEEFAHVVGERDDAVGLEVAFPKVDDDKIIYQFHTDPFPGLKGHVAPEKLDATYLNFKIDRLLGTGWTYETTKHLWLGDNCSEHVIVRSKSNDC